jgi:hypothetical protein
MMASVTIFIFVIKTLAVLKEQREILKKEVKNVIEEEIEEALRGDNVGAIPPLNPDEMDENEDEWGEMVRVDAKKSRKMSIFRR